MATFPPRRGHQRWAWLAVLLGCATAGQAETAGAPGAKPRGPSMLLQRTISSSKQFLVFCADPAARSQVASYTEEIKASLLQILGEPDRWKHNIILTLENAAPAAGQPPAVLSVYQNDGAFKVQVDVRLGAEPSKINLQRLLVRALLLEFAYRDKLDQLKPGTSYVESPWWLIEGAMQIFLRRETGLDSDLFKRIVDLNRLPPISKFLAGRPSDFDGSAVETMDQACAMCLLQLLIDQPGGRASLVSLIRHWPQSDGDSVAILTKEFSGLGPGEQGLQKWWTLNLARFSAADRYKGLTSAETEAELAAALRLQIASPGSAVLQTYPLADFPSYLKLPGKKEALAASYDALVALGTRATSLYQPLVAEYAEIVKLLGRGKTFGLKGRLAKADDLHAALSRRMSAIADYLNWVEATQMTTRSGKFEGYLKAAGELAEPSPRQDPLSRFMDQAEAAP